MNEIVEMFELLKIRCDRCNEELEVEKTYTKEFAHNIVVKQCKCRKLEFEVHSKLSGLLEKVSGRMLTDSIEAVFKLAEMYNWTENMNQHIQDGKYFVIDEHGKIQKSIVDSSNNFFSVFKEEQINNVRYFKLEEIND